MTLIIHTSLNRTSTRMTCPSSVRRRKIRSVSRLVRRLDTYIEYLTGGQLHGMTLNDS